MKTDFDDLLRDTLRSLADRAPDPAAVRAGIDQRRRPRFPLVAVAAVVLLTAVAVPLLRAGGEGGAPPARFLEATPRETWVGLNPTWLPPGITEQARTVSEDGAVATRSWHTGPLDDWTRPSLHMRVEVDGPSIDGAGMEAVQLGDMGTGYYFDKSGVRGVIWTFDTLRLQLDAPFRFADRDTVLRIASGMRRGYGSATRTSLEFGYLPDPMPMVFGVRASATGDQVQFAQATMETDEVVLISAELTPIAPVTVASDVAVTVLGRPARAITDRPRSVSVPTESLVVDLGGRWLVVRYYAMSPDLARVSMLIQVAETMRIGPDVGNSWLGTR